MSNEGLGHNHVINADGLRDIFERLRRLDREIQDRSQDRADVMSEARAQGYDVKVVRLVLQRSLQDRDELSFREELVKKYEEILFSLGGGK